MPRRMKVVRHPKPLPISHFVEKNAENERFHAEVDVMVDAIFSGIHDLSTQGIDSALLMIMRDEAGLHAKALNLANQMIMRSARLDKEIHRFLEDSKSA